MDTRDPNRRFERQAYLQPALVERINDSRGAFVLTRDVGLGGFAFVSPESMGPGEPVRATISLEKEMVVAEGRVAWEHPAEDGRFRVGVEFTRMDPVHRALYRSVMDGI